MYSRIIGVPDKSSFTEGSATYILNIKQLIFL